MAATRLGIKIIVVLKNQDDSWGSPSAFGDVNKKKKEKPVTSVLMKVLAITCFWFRILLTLFLGRG